MSPKVNAFITQEYGEQEFKLPLNVKEVKGCRFKRMKYSYDVKNCDYLMLPYFRRLVREMYPNDEKKILANVKYLGGTYELPQFPSGICTFMRYAPMCFATAYLGLENYNSTFQVQGDGIFSEVEIEITGKHVHREPDYTINGFYYDEYDLPHYVNADKQLTTPQILGTSKITGELLWKFRREIYVRFLKAKVTVKHHIDFLGNCYEDVTCLQLLRLADKADIHIAKICDVLEVYGDTERLEMAKQYLRKKELKDFNRVLTWEANPSNGHLG